MSVAKLGGDSSEFQVLKVRNSFVDVLLGIVELLVKNAEIIDAEFRALISQQSSFVDGS